MADPVAYVLMSDRSRANVQKIVDTLTHVGETIGGWTYKLDARQTGASIHFKFTNKVDALGTTVEFAHQLSESPALLADACRKLLAADAALAREIPK